MITLAGYRLCLYLIMRPELENGLVTESVYYRGVAARGGEDKIRRGVDKLLKYRFSEDVIKELLRMQWWNWDDEKIKESFALFPKPEKFIEKYR